MKASIILSIVVSVLGGAHIVNAQSTNPEPACAVSCFASQPLVGGCTAGDTPCLCSKPTFIESVSSCFTSTCLDNESTEGWSISIPSPSQSTAPINPTGVNTPILTASGSPTSPSSTPTATASTQSDTSKAKPALIGGISALVLIILLFLTLWIRRELRIKRERTWLPRRISMRRAQREGWVDMSSLERSGGVPRDMVLDFRAREGERDLATTRS